MYPVSSARILIIAYLFLLHEFCVWYIVHHAFTENWRCQDGIDLFGVQVFKLAIQDKLVPFWAQINRYFPPKENEGEDIAILRLSQWGKGA